MGRLKFYFDATIALERLDDLLQSKTDTAQRGQDKQAENELADLVKTFEQELGRLLTPFEIEDLTQTVKQDQTDPDIVKAALREAVFNGKPHWKYIPGHPAQLATEGITSLTQLKNQTTRTGSPSA